MAATVITNKSRIRPLGARFRAGLAAAALVLVAASPVERAKAEDPFPSFLPPYFAPALTIPHIRMRLTDQGSKENHQRYVYTSEDQVVGLVVEGLGCDPTVCKSVYDNALRFIDTQVTSNGGSFERINETEFRADWQTALGDTHVFAFRLSNALTFWTYNARLERNLDLKARFDEIKSLTNRRRYEDALKEGYVEIGHWQAQVHDYARQLLKDRQKNRALHVLTDLLAGAPFDYEAHMEFAENTSDAASAKESARVVLDNAEDPALLTRAAGRIATNEPSLESFPLLDKGETGLQLILIPIPPANARLLAEAAPIYEKITGVPVKIRRIAEELPFGEPDRIPDEKRIRQAIVQAQGSRIDFTGWPLERYVAELMKTVATGSALNRYWTKVYADKLPERPSQYRIDPYLARFLDILARYRSSDPRTMYVGVTEDNLFSGDENFLFSLWVKTTRGAASIMSYSMMLAKTLGEPFESRKRLTERIAKELVPASLKSLDIARPSDPTDPYSYSSGVERLNQKTLVLSDPVKKALDKFR